MPLLDHGVCKRVGRQHKVRSFFNNISDPWEDASVTIDTHAVAAALLEPVGGRDPEVKRTSRGSPSSDGDTSPRRSAPRAGDFEPGTLVAQYAAWMPTLTTRADLTLRCRASMQGEMSHGRRISLSLNDDLLRATIVRTLNRLNGYAVGIRRTGGRARLDALVWSERGSVSGRPHVHGLIERPQSVAASAFAVMLARAWRAQPFGYHEVKIDEIHDIDRSIAYNAKSSPGLTGHLVYFHKEPDGSAWWRVGRPSPTPEHPKALSEIGTEDHDEQQG
jgi:hypothetical protein